MDCATRSTSEAMFSESLREGASARLIRTRTVFRRSCV